MTEERELLLALKKECMMDYDYNTMSSFCTSCGASGDASDKHDEDCLWMKIDDPVADPWPYPATQGREDE